MCMYLNFEFDFSFEFKFEFDFICERFFVFVFFFFFFFFLILYNLYANVLLTELCSFVVVVTAANIVVALVAVAELFVVSFYRF